MSYPSVATFGIVENPLIYTPFAEGNSPSTGGVPPHSAFILMDGELFGLMAGGDFLIMGS